MCSEVGASEDVKVAYRRRHFERHTSVDLLRGASLMPVINHLEHGKGECDGFGVVYMDGLLRT